MQFARATNNTCGEATGVVVVIDVIRAFTTAAYAFAAGARDIVLVSEVEEALALRQRFPGSLAMGEVGGIIAPGFDLGNSPTRLEGHDLTGRRIIQRTGAGTQGVVRSERADTLLAASFVCAGATARAIAQSQPACVTFVETAAGWVRDAEEDIALADYLSHLLAGERPDPAPFLERVRRSDSAQLFTDPHEPNFPAGDIDLCVALDRFDFAMQVHREAGLLVMRPI